MCSNEFDEDATNNNVMPGKFEHTDVSNTPINRKHRSIEYTNQSNVPINRMHRSIEYTDQSNVPINRIRRLF